MQVVQAEMIASVSLVRTFYQHTSLTPTHAHSCAPTYTRAGLEMGKTMLINKTLRMLDLADNDIQVLFPPFFYTYVPAIILAPFGSHACVDLATGHG